MIASIRGKKLHVYCVIILKQMADHNCLPDSLLVCSLYFFYTGSGENSMIKNRAHAGVPPYVSDAILDREHMKRILILQINIEK